MEEVDKTLSAVTRNPQRTEGGPSFSVLGQEIPRQGPQGVSEGPSGAELQLPQ